MASSNAVKVQVALREWLVKDEELTGPTGLNLDEVSKALRELQDLVFVARGSETIDKEGVHDLESRAGWGLTPSGRNTYL